MNNLLGKHCDLSKLLKNLNSDKKLSSNDDLDSLLDSFNDIYTDNFRHLYSNINVIVTELYYDEKNDSLTALTHNLYKVITYCTDNTEYQTLQLKLIKLFDHINLTKATLDEQKSIENKIEKYQKQLNEIDKNINIAHKKLNNSTKEYISILGIFASIVLGFSGSLQFGTSVLSSIEENNTYDLLLISVVLGWILIRILHMLLKFIYKSIETETSNSEDYLVNTDKLDLIFLFLLIAFWVTNILR